MMVWVRACVHTHQIEPCFYISFMFQQSWKKKENKYKIMYTQVLTHNI